MVCLRLWVYRTNALLGMILKLIDMGVIKEAMKKLQEFRGENKYTLSDTQLGIRDFLREAAKNHGML